MSQQEIVATVSELQELRRMQEELDAEITALQDRIKPTAWVMSQRYSPVTE